MLDTDSGAEGPGESLDPAPLIGRKLLLGEGIDEQRFFGALCRHLGLADVRVEQYGGKNRLGAYLRTLRVRQGFNQLESIAVTRDADDNAAGAFASAVQSIERAGLVAPSTHAGVGQGSPVVGVFVLPGAGSPGMLEDLCPAGHQGDPVMLCITEYLNCIVGRTDLRPANISKARLHIWLASQARTDLRLGEAAERHFVDFNRTAFEPIARFLELLFRSA